MRAISVRDAETYKIVKNSIGREATIVCDPTMLAPHLVFDENVEEIKDTNYILLYYFANIAVLATAFQAFIVGRSRYFVSEGVELR